MKCLAFVAALSFGLCGGACLAQTSAAPNQQTHEQPAKSGNEPGGAVTQISNQCHLEGASLVCATPKTSDSNSK